MARNLAIPFGRFEGMKVKPGDILFDIADNGRKFPYTDADVTDLLADFAQGAGVQEPLTVRVVQTPEGRFLKLLKGFRRLHAANLWAVEHPDFQVPVLVADPEEGLKTLILNIRENVVRKNLNAIDLGDDARRLQEYGKSGKEIADILGVSEAQVSQHLKLVTELPEFIQVLVANRTLTADDAFTILKVDPKRRAEVLAQYLDGKATKILSQASDEGEIITDAVQNPEAPESMPKNDASNKGKGTREPTVRELAAAAGADVGSIRMPELRRYLKDAIDTDGPGSNKGEVTLKKKLLMFLDRKINDKEMDEQFNRVCKAKL